MVYGLEGQGNIARLIEAVARHRFPPWPRIDNRRSAIHVQDAVRAALLAAVHPRAAGQVFLVTDGETYSTRWLYEQIRLALGRAIPAWSLPLWLLKVAAGVGGLGERMTGRAMPLTRAGLDKLTGNAWFASDKIRRDLGFAPRYRLGGEIPLMVGAYRRRQAGGGS
jgi:nucleoside-diphosphate-sugar epimerase